MSGLLRRPRYADVVGTLALLVAMSGTAYAAHALPKNSVGPKQLKDNKVASKDVQDGGIGAADLAAGSVGSAALQPGSVGTANLAPASVTGAQLAAGSVGPAAVGVNAISTTASVKDHTLTLVDHVGADLTSSINGTLSGNTCTSVLATVNGAQVGQFALVGLSGSVAIPNVVFTPARVEVANQVAFRICNPTASSVSLGNIGIRVVTLG